MKKILVMQSRARPEMVAAEQGEYQRAMEGVADVSFAPTLDQNLAWNDPTTLLAGYDGVILGGSGEFDVHGGRAEDDRARATSREIIARITPLIAYIFENNLPVLGICFGHQLIAEIYGGAVTNDHGQKKIGSYEVMLTQAGMHDPLFSQLPQTFLAQYGHKDSVTILPQKAVLLASGTTCRFSALRYGEVGSKAYTTQFHPELTAKDVKWKLSHSPGYLPEGVSVDSIVKESPESSAIIRLWVGQL